MSYKSNAELLIRDLFILALGIFAIWSQGKEHYDTWRLKKRGDKTHGILQMATKRRIALVPIGYSLEVDFGYSRSTFDVTRRLYHEHVSKDGSFTRHELEVVYLPDDPSVSNLPEMLYYSPFSILKYLFGILLILMAAVSVCSQGFRGKYMRAERG